ncbi:MAG: O-methyltransferase [Thermoleophilaceae bacterium]
MNDETVARIPEAPYAFRPAKRIQRMMFCDALRLLRVLRPMQDYQYVGLGHWQFVDFELMRREVGVREMFSLERDTSAMLRYEANKPFGEIELRFGHAYDELQKIDLTVPTIAWLDYVSKLDSKVLRDLQLLVEQAPAGSVIAVTFNCRPDREDQRLDSLIELLGDNVVPGDVDEDVLDAEGLPRVQRRILVEQLDAVAAAREPPSRLKQFMFVRYTDRTPMAFWAAVLADDDTQVQLDHVPFERLDQFVDGDQPLEITVPWLTTREVIHLNEQIRADQTPSAPGIDADECRAYARLHRWYPALPLPL